MKIFTGALLSIFMFAGCAFTPHRDVRNYPGKVVEKERTLGSIRIQTSTPMNNVVGSIRNGFGVETAEISIPHDRNDLIQKALEIEFTNAGYDVTDKAGTALLVRINQHEMELAQESGGVGYWAICDLNLYLKDGSGLHERNVVTNDKVFSYWYVTASEGVDVFYKNTNQCAQEVVKVVQEKVK